MGTFGEQHRGSSASVIRVWRKPDGLLWQDPLPAKARTILRFGQYIVISTPIEYEDDHCVYYERINDVIYVDYLGLTNRK